MKLASIPNLAALMILLTPSSAHATVYTDMVAVTQNPPVELKKLGLTLFKDNKFKHRFAAPILDAQGTLVTITSGEVGVDIARITVNGEQVEIVYENGVTDNLVMDLKAGAYKVVTQTVDKKILPPASGRIFRDQNCKLSEKKIQVGEHSFPFEVERLGGLGGTSAQFRELFAAGICAPLDCEYDSTQKATFVRGVMLSEKMSFQTHAIGNYAGWQKAGVCKKVDMKCSFTTVPDTGKVHVKALGVAVGTPISDWQSFGDQVRDARDFYGCTFDQVDCSLKGGKGGLGSLVPSGDAEPIGLQIGSTLIPATLPSVSGIAPSSTGVSQILSQLGRLKGVCQVECKYKRDGNGTQVTFNSETQRFPAEASFANPSNCNPDDGKAVVDAKRKIYDESGEGASPAAKPASGTPRRAGGAR